MRRVRLSRSEARRIALAAQGFDRPRPERPDDVRHYRRVLADIAVLQLDYVNVLLPAHFLVLWSRLGAYDRSRLERWLYDSGEVTEQWAHEASIVSQADWPVLAHRRAAFAQHKNSPLHRLPNRRQYLDRVLAQVREEGALTAHDLPPVPGPRRKPGDWHRSIPRWALEHHFGCGRLAVARRLPNFQRVYDVAERVIGDPHRRVELPYDESIRRQVHRAATALGVATLKDIADYYRLTPSVAAPAVAALEKAGQLQPIAVDGWQEPAWLSQDARLPRDIPGASLLSPFDPMTWFRPRAERLFDFEYRIEIYVPAAKRRWGYYVLPFRMGMISSPAST